MNRVVRAAWLFVGVLVAAWPSQARADSERAVDVELRPGVESSVHVRVRENARYRGHCWGPTLAFVHGLAHSARSWDPLVDEIFESGRHGLACKALLIDLPGHGSSPPPSGLTFGEHGTSVVLVNPSQDKFSLRAEAEAAYVQLTGDARKRGFVAVDDEFAVHDMHVAEPRKYLRLALRGFLGSLR